MTFNQLSSTIAMIQAKYFFFVTFFNHENEFKRTEPNNGVSCIEPKFWIDDWFGLENPSINKVRL